MTEHSVSVSVSSTSSSLDKIIYKSSDFQGIRGTFRLSMWIPTEAAGKVIGKKGAVITHLQRTTQSEVIVLTIPEVGSELWSPVSITGEPLRALQAYELIKDIVEETDDIVVEFPVPKQKIYHGLFYGNHNDAVKHLSAMTNVRINIPDGHSPVAHHITLEGSAENVYKALFKFAEVISNPEYHTFKTQASKPRQVIRSGENLSQLTSHDGIYEQSVKVPSPIVGILLVRRSTTEPNIIHQIRQLTGTVITKSDNSSDSTDNSETTPNNEENVNNFTGIGEDGQYHNPKFNPRGYEILNVRGPKENDVVLAASCLSRIVDGEKIFFIMNELKLAKSGNDNNGNNNNNTNNNNKNHSNIDEKKDNHHNNKDNNRDNRDNNDHNNNSNNNNNKGRSGRNKNLHHTEESSSSFHSKSSQHHPKKKFNDSDKIINNENDDNHEKYHHQKINHKKKTKNNQDIIESNIEESESHEIKEKNKTEIIEQNEESHEHEDVEDFNDEDGNDENDNDGDGDGESNENIGHEKRGRGVRVNSSFRGRGGGRRGTGRISRGRGTSNRSGRFIDRLDRGRGGSNGTNNFNDGTSGGRSKRSW